MTHPRQHNLVIFGATTALGREVACLGRALGHRIFAVYQGDPPTLEEPWMHGVQWLPLADVDLTELRPRSVLYCDTALVETATGDRAEILRDRPRRLIAEAESLDPPPRFVLRSTVDQPFAPEAFTTLSRETEQALTASTLRHVILRMPLLYGPERPDSVAAMMITQGARLLPGLHRPDLRPLPIPMAAMAMLRASLEPDTPSLLTTEEIAHLGDAVIAQ